jgi:hypothetical protein
MEKSWLISIASCGSSFKGTVVITALSIGIFWTSALAGLVPGELP